MFGIFKTFQSTSELQLLMQKPIEEILKDPKAELHFSSLNPQLIDKYPSI